MTLSDIPKAIAAIELGRPIIVVDDEDRENEGDIVLSAELASPEWIAWTVRNSSGFICAAVTNSIADELGLPLMWPDNQDPRGTAYTVTVDASDRHTTGISATDRSHTLNVLAAPESDPSDLTRPGHILPLRAVNGGVLERNGHTEAAVDLMRIAGLREAAAIAEVVGDDGDMARLPELLAFGSSQNVPVITIATLQSYVAALRRT